MKTITEKEVDEIFESAERYYNNRNNSQADVIVKILKRELKRKLQ